MDDSGDHINVQKGDFRRSARRDLALDGGVPLCLGGRRYPRWRRHVDDEKRVLRRRSAPLDRPSRPSEKGRTSHSRWRGRVRAAAAGEGEPEPRPSGFATGEGEPESPPSGFAAGGERQRERERERKRTGEMGRRRAAAGCLEEIRFGSFLFCPFTFF